MDQSRTLSELTTIDEPAWPWVERLLRASPVDFETIPAAEGARADALVDLQVTTRSTLGALVWNCGAILIDHGWVKLLGAGVGDLPAAHVEVFPAELGRNEYTGALGAIDVLGGLFLIHGYGLEAEAGEACYWAPDTQRWEPMGFGHSGLVQFLLSDRLGAFYADLRWDGWERDAAALAPDQGISVYPPPFTKEGRNANPVSRVAAPLRDIVGLNEWLATETQDLPEGTRIKPTVKRAE